MVHEIRKKAKVLELSGNEDIVPKPMGCNENSPEREGWFELSV